FAKKGNASLALPKMDLPIAQMNWEVFLPEQFKVANFAGDVAPAHWFPVEGEDAIGLVNSASLANEESGGTGPGQLGGLVTDETGAVIPNATVTVTQGGRTFTAVTNSNGRWILFGVPSGAVTITVQSRGFRVSRRNFIYDAGRSFDLKETLAVGSTTETLTV